MAITGIRITTTDTVLGRPIDVNTTSMLIIVDENDAMAVAVDGRSVAEFEELGDILEVRRGADAVRKYFHPTDNLSLEGNLLWVATIPSLNAADIVQRVRQTIFSSFDKRPRQLIILSMNAAASAYVPLDLSVIQEALSTLHQDSIRCVAIASDVLSVSSLESDSFPSGSIPSVSDNELEPFASVCITVDSGDVSPNTLNDSGVARVGGLLASLSVGTSIGDGGLAPLSQPNTIPIYTEDEANFAQFDTRNLPINAVEDLGESQYLFTRTRPPRNGLWWNDGATRNKPENALSSLEMARTICAIADDLQSFFVPYINTRVPVTSTGDIQSAYKQVVLDNARAAVVQKYIENGDISDARINLVAKNNDMIGTRTWEVTLSILPAPTLRWIDGYVFYVNNLS